MIEPAGEQPRRLRVPAACHPIAVENVGRRVDRIDTGKHRRRNVARLIAAPVGIELAGKLSIDGLPTQFAPDIMAPPLR
jgi:hypothetical protein